MQPTCARPGAARQAQPAWIGGGSVSRQMKQQPSVPIDSLGDGFARRLPLAGEEFLFFFLISLDFSGHGVRKRRALNPATSYAPHGTHLSSLPLTVAHTNGLLRPRPMQHASWQS
jgi:hypothetical protein